MPATNTNLLLEFLPPGDRERILATAKEVWLPLRMEMQEVDAMPRHVYFLLSGMASVVVTMPKGGAAEVALIGREGMVGSLALLGPVAASTTCFMQLSGRGYQVRLSDMRKLFREFEAVRTRVLEYAQMQALTTTHIAACNKLHGAEARLARWLLMVRDRVQDHQLPLTQEFLAEMLGTRRTTVALAAGTLQQAGLIEYRRGKMTIISPTRLQEVACDCYGVTRRYFDELYKSEIHPSS